MLTKTDLNQVLNGVRKVVREEIESEIENAKVELQGNITLLGMEVRKDISALSNRVKNVEISVEGVKKELGKVHKSLKKEIKQVSHFQDIANLETTKRVDQIEQRLNTTSFE